MEGNQMKMREALIAMVRAETDGDMSLDALCGRCLNKLHGTCKHDGSCWCEKVIEALSAPPRQCDVGTAAEQVRRYKLFCENHSGWDGQKRFGCLNCPFIDVDECEFAWAQTPYAAEEGAEK